MVSTRTRVHFVVACLLVAGTLAVAGALTARHIMAEVSRLRSGVRAPEVLLSAVATGRDATGPVHVILYSASCGWCVRQLLSLDEHPRPESVVVLVLTATGEVEPAPTVPDGVSVAFLTRAELERAIGRLATPTHVWLDQAGNVRRVAVGFMSADVLRRIHADLAAISDESRSLGSCEATPCTLE